MLIPLLLFMIFVSPASAAEANYYISPRDGVDLRLAPRNNATVSGHLPFKTDVEVVDKQRNWSKVKTLDYKAVVGWVPEGAIRKRFTPSSSGSKSSFFSSFASMFRSQEQPQQTAVLGVRGLEGGEKATSKDAGEQAIKAVEWMDTLHVPQSDVAAFVKEGDLNP